MCLPIVSEGAASIRRGHLRWGQHELLLAVRQYDLIDRDGEVIHGVTLSPGGWPFVDGLPHGEIHIGGVGHGLPTHFHSGISIEDESKTMINEAGSPARMDPVRSHRNKVDIIRPAMAERPQSQTRLRLRLGEEVGRRIIHGVNSGRASRVKLLCRSELFHALTNRVQTRSCVIGSLDRQATPSV